MQSYTTRTIVIKDNNQTKLLHYTQPANIIRIDTLSDDTNKAISQATNDFQETVANTFGAYTTTATIYKNVAGITRHFKKIEELYKQNDLKWSATIIDEHIEAINEWINECYADGKPTIVEF